MTLNIDPLYKVLLSTKCNCKFKCYSVDIIIILRHEYAVYTMLI